VATTTRVFVETGKTRTFASALDWPGWSRRGRDEHESLAALADYLSRYAPVVTRAGLDLPPDTFTVVERAAGDAGTDYGVASTIAEADRVRLTKPAAARLADLVEAAWSEFAEIVAVTPEELRKGPRGGGRDRDKMVMHVIESEAAYARQLGVKHKVPARSDTAAIAALRADLLTALRTPDSPNTPVKWPRRYAARRIAWHVLDHAWEMQDRSTPA
jgi:hypothetical protein